MSTDILSILLIEDEDPHAELIQRAFEDQSPRFKLKRVKSLTEARAELGIQEPALIIADWRLPDGESMELLPNRHDPLSTPIILMTSYGNERIAVEALKSGAVDYVVKSPESMLDMPHIAERAVEQWAARAERARMQKALLESEAQFRLLAENASDMIVRLSTDGQLLYVSPACKTILGYKPDELTGTSSFDIILEEDRPRVRNLFDQTPTNDTYTIAYRALRKDGTAVWLESSARAITDPKTGEVIEIQSASRDITERKRAEEDLVFPQDLGPGVVRFDVRPAVPAELFPQPRVPHQQLERGTEILRPGEPQPAPAGPAMLDQGLGRGLDEDRGPDGHGFEGGHAQALEMRRVDGRNRVGHGGVLLLGRDEPEVMDPRMRGQGHEEVPDQEEIDRGMPLREAEEILQHLRTALAWLDAAGVKDIGGVDPEAGGRPPRRGIRREVDADADRLQVFSVERKVPPEHGLLGFGVEHERRWPGEDVLHDRETEGGFVDFITREVEVECLPKDIPDRIEIDVSGLHLHQSLKVESITVPQGVRLLSEPGAVLVLISLPHKEEEAAAEKPEEVVAEEGAEPEVIKKERAAEQPEEEGKGKEKEKGKGKEK